MPVVQVRIMRMAVNQRLVTVRMGMRCARWWRHIMVMLVVCVVPVPVLVLHRFMIVLVLMPFGKMQPQSQSHQAAGNHQLHG